MHGPHFPPSDNLFCFQAGLTKTISLQTVAFIQAQPYCVERLAAHAESPAVVDLIYHIIKNDAMYSEESSDQDMVPWLSQHRLIPNLVFLLSSTHSCVMHENVSELLKNIIGLSAPPTGGGEAGSMSPDPDPEISPPAVSNNILVRDLASAEVVNLFLSVIFDELPDEDSATTDTRSSKLEDSESIDLPLNPLDMPSSEDQISDYFKFAPASVPASTSGSPRGEEQRLRAFGSSPSVPSALENQSAPRAPKVVKTPETVSSALGSSLGVVIELIRKNNSDFFEQHLYQVLRQTLMQQQKHLADRRAGLASAGIVVKQAPEDLDFTSSSALSSDDPDAGGAIHGAMDSDELDPDELAILDEAVRAVSSTMNVVNFGPLLRAMSHRLSSFQRIVLPSSGSTSSEPDITQNDGKGSPDSSSSPFSGKENSLRTSIHPIPPLGSDRYRVCELYAELLHCSSMSLLNRPPGVGPAYDPNTGTLAGGLDGFQALTEALSMTVPEVEVETEHGLPSFEGYNTNSTEPITPVGPSGGPSAPTSPAAADGSPSMDDPSSPRAWEESTAGTTVAPGNDDKRTISPEASIWEHSMALKARLRSLSSPAPEGLVAGDLLKERFLSLGIVDTLVDLFFIYPWNNFLHNVVYDVLQQCLGGRMSATIPLLAAVDESPLSQPNGAEGSLAGDHDSSKNNDPQWSPVPTSQIPRGEYNRALVLQVLGPTDLCGSILHAYEDNDVSETGPRRVRLGYMGHLSWMVEEAAKALERFPRSLGQPLKKQYATPFRSATWDALVKRLRREQGNADVLGGGRPSITYSCSDSSGFAEDAPVGLGLDPSGGSFASYLSSQIRHTEDEGADSDDDAPWPTSSRTLEATAEASHNPFAEPLTAADWDAEFERQTQEQDERNAVRGNDLLCTSSSSNSSNGSGSADDSSADEASSVESEEEDGYDPFVDLLDPRDRAGVLLRQHHDSDASQPHPASSLKVDSPASPPNSPPGTCLSAQADAHARTEPIPPNNIHSTQDESPTSTSPILIPRPRHRRNSSTTTSSSGSSLELVSGPRSPLGPGVDPESTVDVRALTSRALISKGGLY